MNWVLINIRKFFFFFADVKGFWIQIDSKVRLTIDDASAKRLIWHALVCAAVTATSKSHKYLQRCH